MITGCIDELIHRTGLNMKTVDILVINCSLFSPTPSLCAMVSNHYKVHGAPASGRSYAQPPCSPHRDGLSMQMRADLLTYNLSGMGCSAGLISIELAKQVLENNPGSTALVISTENLTQQLYYGNERAFLLQNTLFRCA